jgi:hypothetical protein
MLELRTDVDEVLRVVDEELMADEGSWLSGKYCESRGDGGFRFCLLGAIEEAVIPGYWTGHARAVAGDLSDRLDGNEVVRAWPEVSRVTAEVIARVLPERPRARLVEAVTTFSDDEGYGAVKAALAAARLAAARGRS